MKADTTLPPDWQWVTRAYELARGNVVCKLWWRNGVPDFRATVSKDPEGMRSGCIAMVEVAWGEPRKKQSGYKWGKTRFPQDAFTLQWVGAGAIEELPYDPLAAAATVELEIHEWLRTRYMPVNWMRRWPDCQGR